MVRQRDTDWVLKPADAVGVLNFILPVSISGPWRINCRRVLPLKPSILRTTGNTSITLRAPPQVARWAAARWNQAAPNCKAGSNGVASSRPNPAAAA